MNKLLIKNIKKKYGELIAVDGVSFEIKKGEIMGLLGPNGAGKSTTISMISTLFKPDAGDITIDDRSILENPKEIQKVLGVVPQEIALYEDFTGYENLKFWGTAYNLSGKVLKDQIEKISEIIGIKDRLKDKVKEYSGGMKRRINIGAALLHEPEILILDEPTVGIDPQSRNHILEAIKDLNEKGMTVIYTTHYMEEVEAICSTINIMDEGKIIASGTKEELYNILSNKERIDIVFDESVPADIIKSLQELSFVDEIIANGQKLEIITNESIKLSSLIKELNGYDILSIDIKKPNLESVFLHLTGKELRD
ncbi:MAG TPA: ATP-binding cassette domain-containing protein [Clostridia bacterium]|nr:ATP-binding cassette domain-containing protein [Clostridia bacterium]